MKNILIVISAIVLFTSCEDTEYPVVFPERYFPAFPESYWVYSNGVTIKVDPGYHKHNYYPDLGSNKQTDYMLVPRIDQHYVYKYSITQNNPVIPLRTLLKIGSPTEWIVDNWEGLNVYRRIEKFNTSDTLVINNRPMILDSVVTVVEYLGSGNQARWVFRESYAPDIGMIRREINIGNDTVIPHSYMVLIRYSITR